MMRDDLSCAHDGSAKPHFPPSALTDEGLWESVIECGTSLFLDYDGTLAPLASRPELATLSPSVRATLHQLAEMTFTAIVSGRDRAEVEALVGLPELAYVGCHGLDMVGPHGAQIPHALPTWIAPRMQSVKERLRKELSGIRGVLIEPKAFSVAVHVRLATKAAAGEAIKVVERLVETDGQLAVGRGKCLVEVLPNVPWNKGRAVKLLIDRLPKDRSASFPIYIGDDLTDETAFDVVGTWGAGIVVIETARETCATHSLRTPTDVERFLKRVLACLLGDPDACTLANKGVDERNAL